MAPVGAAAAILPANPRAFGPGIRCYRDRIDGSLLRDAFAHHVWASVRLIDACLALPPDQLETSADGTYGSILDTVRHLVGSDRFYLLVLTEQRVPSIDEDHMTLAELRDAMQADGGYWSELLDEDVDPTRVTVRKREDGSETHAPVGIRLAQAVHHGTDHRSQVCTALTVLGVQPPDIDVWDFADFEGRLVEIPPTS